jgi:hypothetical protein
MKLLQVDAAVKGAAVCHLLLLLLLLLLLDHSRHKRKRVRCTILQIANTVHRKKSIIPLFQASKTICLSISGLSHLNLNMIFGLITSAATKSSSTSLGTPSRRSPRTRQRENTSSKYRTARCQQVYLPLSTP